MTHIQTRRSFLYRCDPKNPNKHQILAANVDQVFVTVSILHPRLKGHLIDRYLIACEEGNITPIILLNKMDLLENPPPELTSEDIKKIQDTVKNFVNLYSGLGYRFITVSTKTGMGLKEIQEIMHGKISAFSGQSGVGKTSLINVITGSSYKTHSVIRKSQKGTHTTTSAILFHIDDSSYCIDTPGIKSFGTGKIAKESIAKHFHEIEEESQHCRFTSCTHTHEPDCAVKKALDEGRISSHRYLSYCNLMGLEPIQDIVED